MSTTPEDVAVRLSPQGLEDVSAALRSILGDIKRTGQQGQQAFGPLRKTLGDIKSLLPTLGFAAVTTGLISMGKAALDAADNAGKAAQRTGTTAETFSTLEFAAHGANLSTQGLEASLVGLAKAVTEAEKGTGKEADALRRLGIEAKDLQDLDTGEAFIKVATALGKMEDGTRKTQIATALFSKSGAQALVLANDLATNGYGAVAAAAAEAGVVISSETAQAAADANDSFAALKKQTQGLALQFISGFAPYITEAMGQFSDATKGEGVNSMKSFGDYTGRVVRAIIGVFRILGNFVGGVINGIGEAVGGSAATIAALLRGEPVEAIKIYRDTWKDAISNIGGAFVGVFRDVDRLVEDVNREPPEIKVKVRPQIEIPDIEDTDEKQKREKDEKEAAAAAKRLAKEKAQAEKEGREALLSLETELLEARGRGAEAEVQKLKAELAERRKVLESAGMLNSETEQLLEDLERFGTMKINFGDLGAQIEREMAGFERAREQIETDVAAGVITSLDGERRLIELEKSRLPILQSLVAELQKQAILLGSPEAIAEAEALALAIQQVEVSVRNATDPMVKLREAGLDGLEAGVKDVVKNLHEVESVEDVFKSLARTVGQALQDIIADMLAAAIRAQILKAIIGGFGGGSAGAAAGSVAAAGGGYIRGPGTSTSDSIPAWLSDGEFVVRAKAVEQPGVLQFLRYINRNMKMPSNARRFADGGLVGSPSMATTPNAGQKGIRILNVVDPAMALDAIGTPDGEETVMNVIERNPGRLSRIVRK